MYWAVRSRPPMRVVSFSGDWCKQVYTVVEPIIVSLSSTYTGSKRVTYDASEKYAYNFIQVRRRQRLMKHCC